MLELKGYQQRSLDELEAYLNLTSEQGADVAFVNKTKRPYRDVPRLPGLPYVCLRIPTGGGKTLMACHALGIAARTLVQADHVLCLWLVPTNTIREQTLAALRDRQHPYRQAVDARFGGQVRVMELAEALYVQRGVLDGETVIIVSTLAALRVEDTDGRKVYEEAGALQHHFTGLAAELEANLERREDGSVPSSLANVLRVRRPLVIVDEAHNARTPLSFDTLARFNPSCIIEFTATPQTQQDPAHGDFASNILCHVSAAELKAEEMVKLPIKLRTHADWRQAVSEACDAQRTLEELAAQEQRETGEYIRPIVLLQAQPRSQERQTVTVEVVKKSLIEDFKIPEEQVANATGETREIDSIDLFDRNCALRFIITIQALKEGWDCSFAYVLCSVSETGSGRAVEQVLGRILRLPKARRKKHSELNCAYAFAASAKFADAANTLKDALIENGFQRLEADDLVIPPQEPMLPFGAGTLFAEASELVSEPPDLSKLDSVLRERVSYDEYRATLTVSGVMTEKQKEVLQSCFRTPEDHAAVQRIFEAVRGQAAAASPVAPPAEPFSVPLLAIRVGDQLEILDEGHFLDAEWNLARCDPALSEFEFPLQDESGAAFEVDVNGAGRVGVRFVERLQEQLALLGSEPGWTSASLANWLDRRIPHRDVPWQQSSLFVHSVITGLIERRGLSLNQLARRKFRLARAIEGKIEEHRQANRNRAFNGLLFDPQAAAEVVVDPSLCFTYDEDRYAPNSYYAGAYEFKHHYFKRVGDLASEGEEFQCALFLDSMREVKYWVRNLSQRPDSSFWLQTATDRFYPDFAAKLHDGRILVVEYKNANDWSNDDSTEKRAVGELWAGRSGGSCLFVMPKGTNWAPIKECVSRSWTGQRGILPL